MIAVLEWLAVGTLAWYLTGVILKLDKYADEHEKAKRISKKSTKRI